jgi:hypothetical protein
MLRTVLSALYLNSFKLHDSYEASIFILSLWSRKQAQRDEATSSRLTASKLSRKDLNTPSLDIISIWDLNVFSLDTSNIWAMLLLATQKHFFKKYR